MQVGARASCSRVILWLRCAECEYLMYESFFGLREKPFSITPDPRLIYWGRAHRMAYAMLEFGFVNRAGFIVITGEIGSGKTTLMRHLLGNVQGSSSVGLITNTPRGREELLQWIMLSFGQPYDQSYIKTYDTFVRFLRGEWVAGRRTILIVDEAQNLDAESIEELRMLSNVSVDDQQILQLILIGQPQLRDLLRQPRLEQFAQRVSVDFHLKPLERADVSKYIAFRLAAVGAERQIFDDAACDLIATASNGVPRVINIICDTAMVYAFSGDDPIVTSGIVQQVIEDRTQYGVIPLGMQRA